MALCSNKSSQGLQDKTFTCGYLYCRVASVKQSVGPRRAATRLISKLGYD